jgi:hypothetical protein
MDTKIVEDIRKNLTNKTSDELLQIWKENDRERWSEMAFEATKQILNERGIELPPQDPPKEAKPQAAPRRSRQRTSARIFIVIVAVWWAIVIAGLIREPTPSDFPLIGAGIAFLASCFWFVELGRRELRKPLPLVLGLLCAVGMFYGLFIAVSSFLIDGDLAYSIGSVVPVVVLGFLAYRLSFKQ